MKRLAGLRSRALLLAFALSWTVASRSAAEGLVIEWEAPVECPSRDELAAQVNRLIGGAVHSDIITATQVRRTELGYRAHVRTRSAVGAGERVVEHARCDLLLESVALVLALSTLSQEGAPANEEPGDAVDSLTLAVSAQGSALFGRLPRAALGVGGALSIELLSKLRVELRGSYHVPQSETFADGTIGATFRMYGVGARGCVHWTFGAFAVGPCVGADLAHVAARGFGGVASRRGATRWWSAAAGVFGRLSVVESFALTLSVEGVVPLTTTRFVFSDVAPLYRTWPVALQLLFAPEVRF